MYQHNNANQNVEMRSRATDKRTYKQMKQQVRTKTGRTLKYIQSISPLITTIPRSVAYP